MRAVWLTEPLHSCDFVLLHATEVPGQDSPACAGTFTSNDSHMFYSQYKGAGRHRCRIVGA